MEQFRLSVCAPGIANASCAEECRRHSSGANPKRAYVLCGFADDPRTIKCCRHSMIGNTSCKAFLRVRGIPQSLRSIHEHVSVSRERRALGAKDGPEVLLQAGKLFFVAMKPRLAAFRLDDASATTLKTHRRRSMASATPGSTQASRTS